MDPDQQLDTANELPAVMGGVVAMLQAARRWAKRQSRDRLQPHFGWLTRRQKERALRRAAATERVAGGGLMVEKAKAKTKATMPIDLRGAQQHPGKTGVRSFRMANPDHWL